MGKILFALGMSKRSFKVRVSVKVCSRTVKGCLQGRVFPENKLCRGRGLCRIRLDFSTFVFFE